MGANPDRRMGFLVGFGNGQSFVELPVFAVVGDRFLCPSFEDDLHRLTGHSLPFVEREAPSLELVLMYPQAGAKLKASMRKVVQHSCLFSQAHGVVEGQLVYHDSDAYCAGTLGDGAQVHAGRRDLTHMRVLVLDDEVGAVTQFLGYLDFLYVLVVNICSHRRLGHLEGLKAIPNPKL